MENFLRTGKMFLPPDDPNGQRQMIAYGKEWMRLYCVPKPLMECWRSKGVVAGPPRWSKFNEDQTTQNRARRVWKLAGGDNAGLDALVERQMERMGVNKHANYVEPSRRSADTDSDDSTKPNKNQQRRWRRNRLAEGNLEREKERERIERERKEKVLEQREKNVRAREEKVQKEEELEERERALARKEAELEERKKQSALWEEQNSYWRAETERKEDEERKKKWDQMEEWRKEKEQRDISEEQKNEIFRQCVMEHLAKKEREESDKRRYESRKLREEAARQAASPPEPPSMRPLIEIPAFQDASESMSLAVIAEQGRGILERERKLKRERDFLISNIKRTDRDSMELKRQRTQWEQSLLQQGVSATSLPKEKTTPQFPPKPFTMNDDDDVIEIPPNFDIKPLPADLGFTKLKDPLPLVYPKRSDSPSDVTPTIPSSKPKPTIPEKTQSLTTKPNPKSVPVRRDDRVAMRRASLYDHRDRHPYTSHHKRTHKVVPAPDLFGFGESATPSTEGVRASASQAVTPRDAGNEVTKSPLEKMLEDMNTECARLNKSHPK